MPKTKSSDLYFAPSPAERVCLDVCIHVSYISSFCLEKKKGEVSYSGLLNGCPFSRTFFEDNGVTPEENKIVCSDNQPSHQYTSVPGFQTTNIAHVADFYMHKSPATGSTVSGMRPGSQPSVLFNTPLITSVYRY